MSSEDNVMNGENDVMNGESEAINQDRLFDLVCEYIDGESDRIITQEMWQQALEKEGAALQNIYDQEIAIRAAISQTEHQAMPDSLIANLAQISHKTHTPIPAAPTAAAPTATKKTTLVFPILSACASIAAAVFLIMNIGLMTDIDSESSDQNNHGLDKGLAYQQQHQHEHEQHQQAPDIEILNESDDTREGRPILKGENMAALALGERNAAYKSATQIATPSNDHDAPSAFTAATEIASPSHSAFADDSVDTFADKSATRRSDTTHLGKSQAQPDAMREQLEEARRNIANTPRLQKAVQKAAEKNKSRKKRTQESEKNKGSKENTEGKDSIAFARQNTEDSQHEIISGLADSMNRSELQKVQALDIATASEVTEALEITLNLNNAPALRLQLAAKTTATQLVLAIQMDNIEDRWFARAILDYQLIAYDSSGTPIWTSAIKTHIINENITELRSTNLPPAPAVSLQLHSLGQKSNTIDIKNIQKY